MKEKIIKLSEDGKYYYCDYYYLGVRIRMKHAKKSVLIAKIEAKQSVIEQSDEAQLGKITFLDCLNGYGDYHGWEDITRKKDIAIARKYMPSILNKPMMKITKSECFDIYNNIRKLAQNGDVTNSHANHIIRILRNSIDYGIDRYGFHNLSKNIFANIKRKLGNENLNKNLYFKPNEYKTFIDNVFKLDSKYFIRFGMSKDLFILMSNIFIMSGCRISEVRALKPVNFKANDNGYYIRADHRYTEQNCYCEGLKNGDKYCDKPISKKAYDYFMSEFTRLGIKENDFIFMESKKGIPYTRQMYSRILHSMLDLFIDPNNESGFVLDEKFKKFGPHKFRVSYINHLIHDLGLNQYNVAAIVGDTPEVIGKYYARLDREVVNASFKENMF